MGVEARGRPFDEGEMKGVGRRFGSTPTGCGRAMDSGAWSGGSVGGGRRAQWAELGRTAGYSGQQGKIPKKINKRAAMEFWARLISGCVEKKKKIFRLLIQGMIFKFNFFKYLQTKFELDIFKNMIKSNQLFGTF
jgi:hypothetical protein